MTVTFIVKVSGRGIFSAAQFCSYLAPGHDRQLPCFLQGLLILQLIVPDFLRA